MKQLLLIACLGCALSACVPIELSVQRMSVPEQDLPYKRYFSVTNVCAAADGGLTSILLRTATNQPSSSYVSPYLQRTEVVAIKTDTLGKVQWTKLVVSNANGFASKPFIYPLPDGSYLVYVFTQTNPPTNQGPLLIHLDSRGDVLTQQTLANNSVDVNFQVIRILSLGDKGCVISGFVGSTVGPNPMLLRFDGQGRLLWSRSYLKNAVNTIQYGLAAAPDGSLLLSWTANSINSAESFLLKTDANGEQVWFRKYTPFAANLVSATPDNGCVLLGQINASPVSTVLYKLNRDGDVLANTVYPVPAGQTNVSPIAVFALSDTRVLTYFVSPGIIDFVTTDGAGAELNRQSVMVSTQFLPGTASDLIRLPDGSFAFAGFIADAAVLYKTKPDKTLQWSTILAANK